jgi:putative SOS response-associated peptidase YedK
LVGAPRYPEGKLVSNKETSGIRPRRLNVHITEWTGGKGAKQPHLYTAADGSPVLAFAGLWDRWRDPATREEILSCTIIVSGASAWMEPYHDRMPVLLEEKDFDAWLDGSLGPEALKPAPESALREWTISPRLNRTGVGDDDPSIIEPIIVEPTAARPLLDKAAK